MSEKIKNIKQADFRPLVEGTKNPVLVDFWAPWCGPCRAIGSELEAVAEELDGKATVAKVNVDEEPELAQHYGVQSIPNMIIFKAGKPIRQLIGFHTRGIILEALKQI